LAILAVGASTVRRLQQAHRQLVQALYETGASRYVFCVKVDAVIAALLLAVLWKDYRSGALTHGRNGGEDR
jgi:ABC-type glucose/galactose transport system permease subunit